MRYLHTMLRVRNLDVALKFYSDALGLASVEQCTTCTIGAACRAGTVVPTVCNAGTYASASGQECVACATGRTHISTTSFVLSSSTGLPS